MIGFRLQTEHSLTLRMRRYGLRKTNAQNGFVHDTPVHVLLSVSPPETPATSPVATAVLASQRPGKVIRDDWWHLTPGDSGTFSRSKYTSFCYGPP